MPTKTSTITSADHKYRMIEIIVYALLKKAQRIRKLRRLLQILEAYRMQLSLRDRHFLHSDALLKNVRQAPWYVLYRDGSDSDLIAVISLTRLSFEKLLAAFKLNYIVRSGTTRGGRPPRVKHHHCVLGLLLHTYCCPSEHKTWSEMFGIAPSTLSRTLIKAEIALQLTLESIEEAKISWPSKNDQVRMALLIEKKVIFRDMIS